MTTTSRCWLCGTEVEHIPSDGDADRQKLMALERHLDKTHTGEPFTASGWRRPLRGTDRENGSAER